MNGLVYTDKEKSVQLNVSMGFMKAYIAGLVVNYGISNTIVLEIP